jgi:hypothetical protein
MTTSAIQSTPIIPPRPRRDGSGRGWRSLRGPQCSALVRWHVWQGLTYSATSKSWPTQKTRRRTSYPVLARPKCPPSVPSWHSRSTCARSPPPGMQSRSASPMPAAVQQAAAHQECHALRSVGGGGEMYAAPVHKRDEPRAGAAPRMMGPKIASTARSAAKVGSDERRREEEVVRGNRLRRGRRSPGPPR